MKWLPIRIRKEYLDEVIVGTKRVEYRKDNEFWRIRIQNLATNCGFRLSEDNITFPRGSVGAVFICGKRIHRREIIQIRRIITPDFFSEQGKKDVNTEMCWAIHLGHEILSKQEDIDVQVSLKEIREGKAKTFQNHSDFLRELKT